MSGSFARRYAAVVLALPLLAACGTNGTSAVAPRGAGVAADTQVAAAVPPAAAPTVASTVAPAVAPSVAPAGPNAQPATSLTAPAPAALVFQIVPGQSKAAFRVREQLAGRSLPNDAVGTTGSVNGQLVFQPDGTLAPGASKVTVDLNSLATDSNMRDQFIKSNTLQTRQFPTATFVPAKAEGLPNPLPETDKATFKLTGRMTIHGVQKDLTWDITATRAGASLTGSATTAFKFGDFGMQAPRAPAVLSVVDDIRLEVTLVANVAK